MNANDLAILFKSYGQLISAYSKIEGMKAENAMRRTQDSSPAYTEDAFAIVTDDIDAVVDYLKNFY